jgi:hypothetical protein
MEKHKLTNFRSWSRCTCNRYGRLILNEAVSDAYIESCLVTAYRHQFFWFQYFHRYYELFVTIDEALLKARSHAIATKCNNLHVVQGCSLTRIYHVLKNTTQCGKVELSKYVLNIDSKFDFIECLELLASNEREHQI